MIDDDDDNDDYYSSSDDRQNDKSQIMTTTNLRDKFEATSIMSSSPVSGFYNYQRPTLTNPANVQITDKNIFGDRKIS